METNPYEYEQSVPWIPQQNQTLANKDHTDIKEQIAWPPSPAQYREQQQRVSAQRPHNVLAPRADARSAGQPTLAGARRAAGQAPKELRMTKARALELVRKFKQSLVVASIISFGSISGLVAYHQIATTTATNSTSSTTSQSTSSSSSSSTNSSSSNSNSSSSNNSSSSSNSSTSSSGGYFNQSGSNNFGSSSSSSSVSGTSVS
ncbi:MAG TPA: hypothetical protein VKV20_18250 [Ktedonobacteraceae bacterium]|jgi:hypothetical protein|nr:hypothetical protein [Ktedonobacteraceae bacterium]